MTSRPSRTFDVFNCNSVKTFVIFIAAPDGQFMNTGINIGPEEVRRITTRVRYEVALFSRDDYDFYTLETQPYIVPFNVPTIVYFPDKSEVPKQGTCSNKSFSFTFHNCTDRRWFIFQRYSANEPWIPTLGNSSINPGENNTITIYSGFEIVAVSFEILDPSDLSNSDTGHGGTSSSVLIPYSEMDITETNITEINETEFSSNQIYKPSVVNPNLNLFLHSDGTINNISCGNIRINISNCFPIEMLIRQRENDNSPWLNVPFSSSLSPPSLSSIVIPANSSFPRVPIISGFQIQLYNPEDGTESGIYQLPNFNPPENLYFNTNGTVSLNSCSEPFIPVTIPLSEIADSDEEGFWSKWWWLVLIAVIALIVIFVLIPLMMRR